MGKAQLGLLTVCLILFVSQTYARSINTALSKHVIPKKLVKDYEEFLKDDLENLNGITTKEDYEKMIKEQLEDPSSWLDKSRNKRKWFRVRTQWARDVKKTS